MASSGVSEWSEGQHDGKAERQGRDSKDSDSQGRDSKDGDSKGGDGKNNVGRKGAGRTRFNPFLPEFASNPYAMYRELREQDPVQRGMGMWILTRHADVFSVMTDRSFSSAQIPAEAKARADKLGETDTALIDRLGLKAIVFTDNPDHARLRALVNRPFGPRLGEARRPFMEEVVNRHLDAIIGRGPVDFVAAVADPVPLAIMADFMGLPEEARPAIKDWTHRIRFLLEPGLMTREIFRDVRSVLEQYMALFRNVIRKRGDNPGDDLLGQLLTARAGNESLTEEEVIFAGIMTFVAGHETTKCLLGNGLLALLRHPREFQRLREDPALLPGAVNEMFRFDSPLQQTKRKATRDFVVGGKTIAADDQVLLCIGAANRDPERFPDPDRFDIGRSPNPHLGLGYGMHQCLGGLLAKTEAQVVFQALLQRTTDIRLAVDSVDWLSHSFIIRGLKALPVVVT
jgi:cytochrome P450